MSANDAGIEWGMEKAAALRKGVRLQPHQSSALKASKGKGGILLNHGLGSGKTLSSMAIAEHRRGNVLVVVPASLRENYKKQLKEFVTDDRQGDYHIMSYEKFRRDPEAHIARIKPNTMVADEVHRLRNFGLTRQAFERVRKKVPHMVGLTGTVINNRPEEVVPLTNLVAGHKVDTQEGFKRRYIKTEKVHPNFWGKHVKKVAPGEREVMQNHADFKTRYSPHIHQFRGSPEYKKHMPKVTEEEVRVHMTPHQEKLYAGISQSDPALAYKIRKNLPPSKKELANMNAFMTAARQVSNNPAAYDKKIKSGDHMRWSPKFKRMVHDVHRRAKDDPNFRAVTYSSFLHSGVHPQVAELKRKGIKSHAFTGGISDKKRKAMVEDLNQGRVQVLGLSPAGGEGLDLKGVRQVNITEEHWNPQRAGQAIGRATRYKSHAHLPEEHRNVLVKRYFATHKPRGLMQKLKLKKTPMSADEYINQRRVEKHRLNEEFTGALDKKAFLISKAKKLEEREDYIKRRNNLSNELQRPANVAMAKKLQKKHSLEIHGRKPHKLNDRDWQEIHDKHVMKDPHFIAIHQRHGFMEGERGVAE
jgi:SNF2 family DNA or RNA helicase